MTARSRSPASRRVAMSEPTRRSSTGASTGGPCARPRMRKRASGKAGGSEAWRSTRRRAVACGEVGADKRLREGRGLIAVADDVVVEGGRGAAEDPGDAEDVVLGAEAGVDGLGHAAGLGERGAVGHVELDVELVAVGAGEELRRERGERHEAHHAAARARSPPCCTGLASDSAERRRKPRMRRPSRVGDPSPSHEPAAGDGGGDRDGDDEGPDQHDDDGDGDGAHEVARRAGEEEERQEGQDRGDGRGEERHEEAADGVGDGVDALSCPRAGACRPRPS